MSQFLTIAAAAKLIADKQLSPVELTRTCLDRISKLDAATMQSLKLRIRPRLHWRNAKHWQAMRRSSVRTRPMRICRPSKTG